MLKYLRAYQKKSSLPRFSSCFGGVSPLAWYQWKQGLSSQIRPRPESSGHNICVSSQPSSGMGAQRRQLTAPGSELTGGQDWSPVVWLQSLPCGRPGLRNRRSTPIARSAWFQLWAERCNQAGCRPLEQPGERKFPRRAGWSVESLGSASSMPETVSSGGHSFLLGAKMQVVENETLGISLKMKLWEFTHSSKISQRRLRWRVGWPGNRNIPVTRMQTCPKEQFIHQILAASWPLSWDTLAVSFVPLHHNCRHLPAQSIN